jgi:RimJ/RimL family protein N-acetyltransferase
MIVGRSARLVYERLGAAHAAALHPVLADARVYAHLGDPPPSATALAVEFAHRAAGPPTGRAGERCVDLAVALAPPGPAPVYIGRIEATVYGDWGEVAYLFGAAHWERGYATEAVAWLHGLLGAEGVRALWAAVTPANARSLALLGRLGYRPVPVVEAPGIGSYDAGDVVLRRSLRARGSAA